MRVGVLLRVPARRGSAYLQDSLRGFLRPVRASKTREHRGGQLLRVGDVMGRHHCWKQLPRRQERAGHGGYEGAQPCLARVLGEIRSEDHRVIPD